MRTVNLKTVDIEVKKITLNNNEKDILYVFGITYLIKYMVLIESTTMTSISFTDEQALKYYIINTYLKNNNKNQYTIEDCDKLNYQLFSLHAGSNHTFLFNK